MFNQVTCEQKVNNFIITGYNIVLTFERVN